MSALDLIEQKSARLGKESLTELEWYLLLDGKANQECRENAAAELEALRAEIETLKRQLAGAREMQDERN